ncbi:Adenylyl-sulfate kinase, chloroplastic [Ananas comosus]|uniref:Adenylyl-sulfate kinase n=1 Tax=Ananas comosus TaxID=4615 RepID=A0A199USU4_ANACO|nr:Adenylyl-sulfate kinase, chloroplastic [Ananas comosus]
MLAFALAPAAAAAAARRCAAASVPGAAPPGLGLRGWGRSGGGEVARSRSRRSESVAMEPGGARRGCGRDRTLTLRNVMENLVRTTVGMSTNIVWHECSIGKLERQNLLMQKGCVIWITGFSGSGKRQKATGKAEVADGDNLRHGLNKDLSFKAEDRAENICRVVAKLFADAGVICTASLISPYRRDRDACRALVPDSMFIEVFMDVPLKVCEERDPKGLYKLARAGKIKGFTGIDDPYEPPMDCEIVIQLKDGKYQTPKAMAEQVVTYLEENGYLKA